MSDIDDESEYEYIDSDVEEESVDDDYDDCSASFKLEVVLPDSFLPATTEENPNTTDCQSPGPITEMSKLQIGHDSQSLSTGTVSSYTFLQPSMMSAQGETNSCASSVISGFEYLSIDGSTLRLCHRCKCLNPEDSVVCLGCCAALVANPNVDMDEQIARHLQQNEEMELLRRKSALRGSSLLSQCDEFCKEISECLQEVISNGSLQPLSGMVSLSGIDITMQISTFLSFLVGCGDEEVSLGIGYIRAPNRGSAITMIKKHGIGLHLYKAVHLSVSCGLETVSEDNVQRLGDKDVYWLVVFARKGMISRDKQSRLFVSCDKCLPLGYFERENGPTIEEHEQKLIKTVVDYVQEVVRPIGSKTEVDSQTVKKWFSFESVSVLHQDAGVWSESAASKQVPIPSRDSEHHNCSVRMENAGDQSTLFAERVSKELDNACRGTRTFTRLDDSDIRRHSQILFQNVCERELRYCLLGYIQTSMQAEDLRRIQSTGFTGDGTIAMNCSIAAPSPSVNSVPYFSTKEAELGDAPVKEASTVFWLVLFARKGPSVHDTPNAPMVLLIDSIPLGYFLGESSAAIEGIAPTLLLSFVHHMACILPDRTPPGIDPSLEWLVRKEARVGESRPKRED